MKMPAESGTVWEVLAGYNTVTHEGVDPYALDLWRTDGPTGGSVLLAPMDGQIGYLSDDCLSIRSDAVNLLLCHVLPIVGLDRGTPVVTGQVLGTVAPDGEANNNGVAHIHLQLNVRTSARGDGKSLPFAGLFTLEGREFPATNAPNAYAGERVTSTNTISPGGTSTAAAPTVDAGPDRTATPGEQVTLTATSTASGTLTWQQVAGPVVLPGVLTGNTVTFTAPAQQASLLQFIVVAEGQGGVAFAHVSIDVSNPSTPPSPPSQGVVVSGEVHVGGVSLVVFGGGSSEEMMQALTCPGVVSVWASGSDGGFIRYAHDAPSFVNAQWHQRFPDGLPAPTPLLINCH